MENQPFFSIIMPVYNVELYLKDAVRSVQIQTYKDYELILIDDCSKDHSGQICDYFYSQDNRIKVIHKEKNEGLAYARNTGLKEAKGKWVIFMDSDDWIESNLLEELYKNIQNREMDIIVWGYCQEFMGDNGTINRRSVSSPEKKEFEGKKEIAKACIELDEKRSFAYAWNKVYKKRFLNENHLLFENIPLMEDFFFNIKAFPCADSIITLNEIYSHYRKPPHETLVGKYSPDFFGLCKKRFDIQKELVEKYDIYTKEIKAKMLTVYVKHLLSSCIKEVSEKSGLNLKEQYVNVKKIVNDKHTCEVLDEKIAINNFVFNMIKIVFKMRWTLLVFLLAKMAYKFQKNGRK